MSITSKKAIFFDFGDTLASTAPAYILRIAAAMRMAGYTVQDREFEAAYVRTDYDIYLKYKKRGEMTNQEYVDWFFPILCRHLSLDKNSYAIRAKMRKEMKQITFTREVIPGAIEVLESLKERGYTLGVISNNDGKVEEKCDEVGIKQYFHIIADSTNLGFIKPDSRIFHFVLNKLKLSEQEAIHVGDLYGSDVMGGTNAGLDVIWFNNRETQKYNGSPFAEVENLIEIKDILIA